jgi:hypothetical protein
MRLKIIKLFKSQRTRPLSEFPYVTGEQGHYPVTSFMKLKDVDLSRPVS